MKSSLFIGVCLIALSAACGTEGGDLSAEIQTRTNHDRDALVGLMPVLDFADVGDGSFASRVVVDEIILQVFDVRLLGLDPRIPTGGMRLIDEPETVLLTREMHDQIEFAFPAYLQREDLAVYLRISPATELDGASVLVRGRLYATAAPEPDEHRTHSLVAGAVDAEGAVDPDGEPASPSGKGAVDPDGEPASPSGKGAVDPDGEPADCEDGQRCQGLSADDADAYVSFELQGDQVVELQAGFGTEEALDVVLGIPAARWFTPETVRAMNAALALMTGTDSDRLEDEERSSNQGARHIVLKEDRMGQFGAGGTENAGGDRLPDGDYSLRPGGGRGPDGTQGW